MLFRARTLHRTAFDYSAKGLTLRASAEALFNAAQTPVVRVRSPYSEEPAYGGFLLSGIRTLHRTAFDYSAKGLTLRASAEALFNAAQTPVVRPVALFRRTRLWRVFAFWDTDSPSNCVRLFGLSFPRRNQPNQCQYARFSDQHQIEMSGESDINKPKDQEDRQRNRPSEHKEPGIA